MLAAKRRRKAKHKAKGESESSARRRKRQVESEVRWRQVPDRNLRLPDERARLRADGGAARAGGLRADGRRPRRGRHRHQHLQRARARRREALHAARRDSRRWASDHGHAGRSSRSPAASRSRKARRSSQALDAPSTSSSARRASSGCRCSSTEAVDASGRRAPRRSSTSIRYDDVSFPLGIARRGDPLKAYVTIIEGCNEFCAFCVVPYTRGHERMRPAADILAEVAARRRHRRAGSSAPRADREPLPGAGRSRRATSRRCSSASTTSPGIERIRFASPHPRHVTPRMIDAMRDLPKVCRHLHLPVQSGSTRVLAGHAAAPHARGLPRARRRGCARPCRTSRSRPI